MCDMTEDQIEDRAERMMDAADAAYMAGYIDADTYNAKIAQIDAWTRQQFDQIDAASNEGF